MIPLRHTLPRKRVPIVNRTLVAINVALFFGLLFSPETAEMMIQVFGFMPARLLHPAAFNYTWWEAALTLVTSLFLHGGFVHLAGNMIYLWVFGGAMEDSFGRFGYPLFFVAAG